MDAIPLWSSLRPKYGTVLMAIRQTHGVTALFGSGCTIIEGMRVVVECTGSPVNPPQRTAGKEEQLALNMVLYNAVRHAKMHPKSGSIIKSALRMAPRGCPKVVGRRKDMFY